VNIPKNYKTATSLEITKLFTDDTVATSKLGSVSSMGVIFACVVFCEATCSINSNPQSTRKPIFLYQQGTFLLHLLLILVLPLLFINTNWKTKSINGKGYISSCSELLLLLLPKKIRFLLLNAYSFRKRGKKGEKKRNKKKSLFLLISVLLNIFFCSCKQKKEGRKKNKKK
jgi:magnesium-transporting ATPase (P-type)